MAKNTIATSMARSSTRRVQHLTPRQPKSKAPVYRDHFLPLMNHVHQMTFSSNHQWTRPELLAVTPDKIMVYLKTKIYDDLNADPNVISPKRYQANTIKCWKKAWSFFMINKMTNWDEVMQHGNPARCAKLNSLIGSMIKMEVAQRGQPSHAHRALTAHSLRKFTVITCARMSGCLKTRSMSAGAGNPAHASRIRTRTPPSPTSTGRW